MLKQLQTVLGKGRKEVAPPASRPPRSNPLPKQHLFLVGWESNFAAEPGWEQLAAALVTHPDAVQYTELVTELVFENGGLVKAFEYQEGERETRELHPDEVGLPYLDLAPKTLLEQTPNPQGLHQLGGEQPADFQLPAHQLVVPFQYLGYLSSADPALNWLPFDLHLTCPIYLNFEELFLDYTDPQRPVLLQQEALAKADTSFPDDLTPDSEIVFEALRFDFTPVKALQLKETGQAGVPKWIQHPNIPRCPKTGKYLQFVCQLYDGPKTLRSNVQPSREFNRTYFDHLNFWGAGDLFVFFEPTSKVACYYIQNT